MGVCGATSSKRLLENGGTCPSSSRKFRGCFIDATTAFNCKWSRSCSVFLPNLLPQWPPGQGKLRLGNGLDQSLLGPISDSAQGAGHWDAIVIGASAAGMMCAAQIGQRGRRVLLIEHARKLAEKIRISGGGRCNFTNRHCQPENFLSQNPHFCRSALARYT